MFQTSIRMLSRPCDVSVIVKCILGYRVVKLGTGDVHKNMISFTLAKRLILCHLTANDDLYCF